MVFKSVTATTVKRLIAIAVDPIMIVHWTKTTDYFGHLDC